MTQIEITHDQAKKLAAFIHELRPDWDERGILPSIHGARTKGGNFDLAIAAIRAASTTSNRTPAVIGMEGPHWHPEQAKPAERKPFVQITGRQDCCGGMHVPGAPCDPPEHQRSHGRDHSRERAAAARAALRAATEPKETPNGDMSPVR